MVSHEPEIGSSLTSAVGGGPLFQLGEGAVILIPEDELVEPDPPVEGASDEPQTDFIGFDTGASQDPGGIDNLADTGQAAVDNAAEEDITNDVILVDLPGPPATP